MQFLPCCEESGLIVPIGAWCWRKPPAACHGPGMALGDVAIAVKRAAVQFLADTLPEHCARCASAMRCPAEHCTWNSRKAWCCAARTGHAMMDELQGDGACISIADFGTGFSSMANCATAAITLKVDSTRAQRSKPTRASSICRALIEIGQGLGLGIMPKAWRRRRNSNGACPMAATRRGLPPGAGATGGTDGGAGRGQLNRPGPRSSCRSTSPAKSARRHTDHSTGSRPPAPGNAHCPCP